MQSIGKNGVAAVLVILVVFFIEMFGIPGLKLTNAQEITAAILIIAAFLWVSEWVPLFIVSFLILALEIVWLYPALEFETLANSASIFFDSFFSNIILLFLGGFILSSLMQKFGLDLKFAQAILSKTKGNSSLTLLGIIVACAFLSMWISNTATTAMMLTMFLPLIKRIPSGHPFKIALVLSIPFACNIGGIGTPIGTPPNAIALSYLSGLDIHLSFGTWMMLSVPFLIFLLFFLWRLLLKLYPPKDLVLSLEERSTQTFGKKHYAAIGIFLVTAVGWIFGDVLGVQTGTVALFPIIVCFWFGLLDTSDFRNLPWDVLYIISGGLALGVALNASGLGAVLANALPGNSYTLFIIGVLIMSIVMSNTATAGLVIPLVIALDVQQDQLLSLIITLAVCCSLVMVLPVTTPPNAIAFSSRAIKTKDMMLCGSIVTVVGIACVLTFGPTYWGFILGL